MTHYNEILEEIYTLLQGVEGIGKVHKYSRWTAREDIFRNLFGVLEGNTFKINGWEITRTKAIEDVKYTGLNQRVHTFLIRGYYSLEDNNASEIEFNLLLEKVCDVLRKKFGESYNPEKPWIYNEPPDITRIGVVMFGNYLIHFAEITFSVLEYVSTT